MRRPLFILIVVLSSCRDSRNDTDARSKAVNYNNNAMRLYTHQMRNSDSLKLALQWIDSAITLNPTKDFYYNKFAISRRLGLYDVALLACNSILSKNSNDYQSNLHKAFIYEDLKAPDSAELYYNRCLSLIDKGFIKGDPIVKDYQRIILFALLGDSSKFNTNRDYFIKKYSDSANFESYLRQIDRFDKKVYLLPF